MRHIRLLITGTLLVGVSLGLAGYTTNASAAVTCTKIRACVDHNCQTWIVCDDGTMYPVAD